MLIPSLTSKEILSEDNKESRPLPKNRRQLVEVLDDGELPDLSKFLFYGAKNERGKNESPLARSSNTFSMDQKTLSKTPPSEEGSPSFLEELAQSKNNEQQTSKTPSGMSARIKKELLNPESHYLSGKSVRKLNIQMNETGEMSVNVMAFPGAEYMIRVAKSIFRYWLDFLPAQMIQMGFIRTDGLGSLQGILAFASEGKSSDSYRVYFLKPFTSRTMNQGTIGAFNYYQMPMDSKIKIRMIGVEMKIYRDTLAVSANFEFQLWDTP